MGLLREMSCGYRGASKTDGATGPGITRDRRPFNRSTRPVKFESVQGGTE
jgi:hypothetical protein